MIMKRIAIIGAGVSGLTMGRLLATNASVTVFESDSRPGGLIKCARVDGNLFHTCGGHVFNTRREDVLDFFWGIFDRDRDFVKADRNSVVKMPDGAEIPYPIENHAYMLDDDTLRAVIADVAGMRAAGSEPANFEEFLRKQFGDTLYRLYFGPYNRKVWRRDLSDVPLSWLEGKLPMPAPEEILYNNIRRVKEKAFVHSSFYYERQGGSQFIADTLAEVHSHVIVDHIVKKFPVCPVGFKLLAQVVFDLFVLFCARDPLYVLAPVVRFLCHVYHPLMCARSSVLSTPCPVSRPAFKIQNFWGGGIVYQRSSFTNLFLFSFFQPLPLSCSLLWQSSHKGIKLLYVTPLYTYVLDNASRGCRRTHWTWWTLRAGV